VREPTAYRARPTVMTSRGPTRLVLALIVAALGLAPALLVAGPAYACSCAQLTLAQQVANADVVVVGAVDSMEGGDRTLEVTIQVEQVVRGDASTGTHRLRTAASGAACGLDFLQVGERYAFLAARVDGGETLVAGLCGGTTALRPGLVDELEAAAADAPPAPPVAETTQASPGAEGGQATEQAAEPADDRDEGQVRRTPVLVALVALATLLVAAGIAAWWRRRR
jgi:hypothetical protein